MRTLSRTGSVGIHRITAVAPAVGEEVTKGATVGYRQEQGPGVGRGTSTRVFAACAMEWHVLLLKTFFSFVCFFLSPDYSHGMESTVEQVGCILVSF